MDENQVKKESKIKKFFTSKPVVIATKVICGVALAFDTALWGYCLTTSAKKQNCVAPANMETKPNYMETV